ncbi:MAG: hypothetical protein M0006_15680 [Magnetospirillum sp.]|nr:hypothetical protein [Magnetospirillum sp.]
MRITCLSTPKSKFGPFTVVYDLYKWPAGTRRNRGWENAPVVFERSADPREIEEAKASPRFISYRYKSWEGVVNDEARFGFDANTLRDAWRGRFRAEPAPAAVDVPAEPAAEAPAVAAPATAQGPKLTKAKAKAAKPKNRAELCVFWSMPYKPVPEGSETLGDGRSVWACTVLDRTYENEIKGAMPPFRPGSGWAYGWTPILPEPKRWSPERKAKHRRLNLRRRLDNKFPLFASVFEAQEIERRKFYFDPEAIEAGTDTLPCQTRALSEPVRKPRLRRLAAPSTGSDEQFPLDLGSGGGTEDIFQFIPRKPMARAARRARLYSAVTDTAQ